MSIFGMLLHLAHEKHWCKAFESLLPPPKKEVMFLVRSVCLSVCLSVCPSDYSQTCERILTKFFVGVGHGSRTKWYNFGGDPDHTSDPGVQSPKSGSSGLPCSAEVCALWVLLVMDSYRDNGFLGLSRLFSNKRNKATKSFLYIQKVWMSGNSCT